ncbi:unnamed protein product, partial [Sphacelaria rigidula]
STPITSAVQQHQQRFEKKYQRDCSPCAREFTAREVEPMMLANEKNDGDATAVRNATEQRREIYTLKQTLEKMRKRVCEQEDQLALEKDSVARATAAHVETLAALKTAVASLEVERQGHENKQSEQFKLVTCLKQGKEHVEDALREAISRLRSETQARRFADKSMAELRAKLDATAPWLTEAEVSLRQTELIVPTSKCENETTWKESFHSLMKEHEALLCRLEDQEARSRAETPLSLAVADTDHVTTVKALARQEQKLWHRDEQMQELSEQMSTRAAEAE